ncbi:hypothetical protein SAMN05216249_11147 [Acetitomaculum ruminis DSM 5522]|uniref:4Fe-4S ferredoxin-type domain-containing protein n=1 Tax=Acetitomaculum ruminis DSM 5522 TaxID=1120918 RepID=A0A1I0YVH4_9FIRM|nr:aldo/keto reductase [Acetitomaculum ruminis]SFB16400.1 hypothetical protein SAMN05216249_11147 [Acetitomaculum ruminis DSM 5522]
MYYNDYKEIKLSGLGFGAMRLPTLDNDAGKIDEKSTAKMVEYAMKNGINYYDTAFGYHMGNSEIVMGKILKNYDRKSFYLATKFPGYDINNIKKPKETFEKQLEKLQVDYFDFYLFHNVCEANIDAYMDEQYGVFSYLKEQKDKGRIVHLGFSTHGNLETMERFLKKYGKDMEFCQIQLNYLDYSFQKAREKIELLEKYNIPIWVMEPLRGGRLSKLTDEQEAILKKQRPDETIPAWGFRFLQTIPSVKMILSGMSDMNQLEENIKTFEEKKPLNIEEKVAVNDVVKSLLANKIIGCTGCGYCLSGCPHELKIPDLIALYNELKFTGNAFFVQMKVSEFPEDKRPQACEACRNCEEVCPQQIKISEVMADFVEKLKQ